MTRPAPHGRWRRAPAVSLALLVLALASMGLGGCRGDDGPKEGQARLEVDGTATVTRANGEVEEIISAATLKLNDAVEITSGTGTVTFAGGTRFTVRAGLGTAGNSTLRVDAIPELVAGEALAVDGAPARIAIKGAVVSVLGTARLDAGSDVVAVYSGRATSTGRGGASEARALRQLLLGSATVQPFAYDGTDPWDLSRLGEAIDFGGRLEAFARGFTADVRQRRPLPSFYPSVLPALGQEEEFTLDLIDANRDPGETLIGASIVVQGRDGTFRERWGEVFGFRDQGALWGLVALDQGVSSEPLLQQIRLAIDERSAPSSTTRDPSTPTTTSQPTSTTTPGATTTTTVSVPPTSPPPTEPPDEPIVPIEPITDLVDQLIGGILDGLGTGP